MWICRVQKTSIWCPKKRLEWGISRTQNCFWNADWIQIEVFISPDPCQSRRSELFDTGQWPHHHLAKSPGGNSLNYHLTEDRLYWLTFTFATLLNSLEAKAAQILTSAESFDRPVVNYYWCLVVVNAYWCWFNPNKRFIWRLIWWFNVQSCVIWSSVAVSSQLIPMVSWKGHNSSLIKHFLNNFCTVDLTIWVGHKKTFPLSNDASAWY